MPIYNWFKIFESNDLRYLVIKGRYTAEELEWWWDVVFDEYIKVFGLDSEFKAYFKQKKELILLENEYLLTKKKSLKFKLGFLRKKFEALNPTKKDQNSFFQVVTAVEKNLNRSIDEKSVSVRKFYTYLKSIKNGQATKG